MFHLYCENKILLHRRAKGRIPVSRLDFRFPFTKDPFFCSHSTPKRRSTRRSYAVWRSASPSRCTVASRRPIPWWHPYAPTRIRSCAGAECTPWRWPTAAPETTRPSASSCTLLWVLIRDVFLSMLFRLAFYLITLIFLYIFVDLSFIIS